MADGATRSGHRFSNAFVTTLQPPPQAGTVLHACSGGNADVKDIKSLGVVRDGIVSNLDQVNGAANMVAIGNGFSSARKAFNAVATFGLHLLVWFIW